MYRSFSFLPYLNKCEQLADTPPPAEFRESLEAPLAIRQPAQKVCACSCWIKKATNVLNLRLKLTECFTGLENAFPGLKPQLNLLEPTCWKCPLWVRTTSLSAFVLPKIHETMTCARGWRNLRSLFLVIETAHTGLTATSQGTKTTHDQSS